MNFLKPAKHIKPLPENQIDDTYKRLRLKYFLGFSSVTLGTIYYVKLFISDAGIARARFYKSGTRFCTFCCFHRIWI